MREPREDADLVLVVPDDDPPDDAPPDHRRAGSPRQHRRVAAAVVTVLAVVMVVGGAARTAADRREAALLEPFATAVGMATGLREPLVEALRLPARELLAVDGDTVLARGAGGALRALDARTGTELWSTAAGFADLDGCRVPDRTPQDRSVQDRGARGGAAAGLAAPPPRFAACALGDPATAVVHVDLGDGTVRARTPLPETLVDWAVLGADLVVALRDGDEVALVRLAPGTSPGDAEAAGVRWRAAVGPTAATRVPFAGTGAPASPVPGSRSLTTPGFTTADPGDADDAGPLRLDVGRGLVTLSGALGAAVRADDGAPLGAWTPDPGQSRVVVTAGPGGLGVWPSPQRGAWFDTAGSLLADLPGAPVSERVTDGTAAEVVLVLSPLLSAVDVRTGAVLWQRGDGATRWPSSLPVRRDGMVVVPEGDRLLGLDVRTGAVRWSAPAPTAVQTFGARPLTDGLRLVVTDLGPADESDLTDPDAPAEPGGAVVLRAIDLATGTDAWTVAAPPSARWVSGIGGRGVLRGGDDVVVLD
nr:PQQ-binding-like beta-propeller repeat protein [uncultured Actinotalea sp.]